MKILNVNAVLDPVAGGGAAERTFQMGRHLARAGASCTVLTLDLGLAPERIAALRPAQAAVLHCTIPRYYLFALPEPQIKALVREADVVHLMGHWTLLNALVARECRRQDKPYAVCPAGALPIYGRSQWIKRVYNRLAGQQLIREASACIAIASNELEHYAAYGVGAERVTRIPNGIDRADFRDADDLEFRRKFNLPDAPFVMFLGRLATIKGPDLLLDAYVNVAAAHPDMHIVFAGPDDGLMESLRTTAAAASVADRIHFIGPVSGPDKSRAYHAASLLAIPSRQEAMSIVVLESGICGTPVLITDRCGFDDVAKAGGGKVVGASVEGLQHGLHEMLSMRERLPALGAALRRFTEQNYLWENVIRQYLALFERLVQQRGKT
jgi:glycosyltransferase involved in cell wall biosynthesis